MEGRTIRFIRCGELVALSNVPPTRTLLELLREDLGGTGTKEGCAEGDCGACTVVLGELEGPAQAPRIRYRAINACIRLAHSIDGVALWTVEDLAGPDGKLHPAQEAMVQSHGSQCGFCTPGFVMSLFGMYQNHVRRGEPITRELAQQELSGNLCRCTGYRPILDAAQAMAQLPTVAVDEAALVAQLQVLRREADACDSYLAPTSLEALLAARAEHPHAQLVAGCTDVGLWVTKMHRQFPQVLDITRAGELRRIDAHADHLRIGAAVTLADAFDALVAQRPQLATFAARFAGLPVRNSGTLGGNIANGSPIGDGAPVLMALGASLVLRQGGRRRRLALDDFYVDYRVNRLDPGEFIEAIEVPLPSATTAVRAFKLGKRHYSDISTVCAAFALTRAGDRVTDARFAYGGMAATVRRAAHAEAAVRGQPWLEATVRAAMAALERDYTPLTDLRGSAAYRLRAAQNLLLRLWLQTRADDPLPAAATQVRVVPGWTPA